MPIGFAGLRMMRQLAIAAVTKKEQDTDHPEVNQPRAIITLVHGTFARGAPWTRPGSRLVKALTAYFGETVQFRYQDWSGFNSFSARDKGARKVAALIGQSRDEHGDIPQYLIGHSHGGNVALQAAIADDTSSLDGVVCLATPVLTTKRRRFTRRIRWMIGIGFFMTLSMPFYSFEESWDATDFQVTAMLVCMVLAALWYRQARVMARKICRKRPYTRLNSDEVSFIRSPFDEASGIIGLVNFLTWIVNRIIAGPFALYDYFVRGFTLRQRVVSALGYSAIFLVAAILDVAGDEVTVIADFRQANRWFDILHIVTIVTMILMSATGAFLAIFAPLLYRLRNNRILWWLFLPVTITFLVIGAILFVPAIVLMSVAHAGAVGVELAICSIFVEVTAEPSPAGRWRLTQLRPPPEGALRHSSVYDSEPGIAAVIASLESFGLTAQSASKENASPA